MKRWPPTCLQQIRCQCFLEIWLRQVLFCLSSDRQTVELIPAHLKLPSFYICDNSMNPKATLQRHHHAIKVTNGLMLQYQWQVGSHTEDDELKNIPLFSFFETTIGDFWVFIDPKSFNFFQNNLPSIASIQFCRKYLNTSHTFTYGCLSLGSVSKCPNCSATFNRHVSEWCDSQDETDYYNM